jgi:hypothetical protein
MYEVLDMDGNFTRKECPGCHKRRDFSDFLDSDSDIMNKTCWLCRIKRNSCSNKYVSKKIRHVRMSIRQLRKYFDEMYMWMPT